MKKLILFAALILTQSASAFDGDAYDCRCSVKGTTLSGRFVAGSARLSFESNYRDYYRREDEAKKTCLADAKRAGGIDKVTHSDVSCHGRFSSVGGND